ncbi:MAG: hypothetical protein HZA93_14995 [Verrucomicrobia bacterium]|nr:hypothetical protein [Verrucomicrobiota bacterium]
MSAFKYIPVVVLFLAPLLAQKPSAPVSADTSVMTYGVQEVSGGGAVVMVTNMRTTAAHVLIYNNGEEYSRVLSVRGGETASLDVRAGALYYLQEYDSNMNFISSFGSWGPLGVGTVIHLHVYNGGNFAWEGVGFLREKGETFAADSMWAAFLAGFGLPVMGWFCWLILAASRAGLQVGD